jgi:hypothetical protein
VSDIQKVIVSPFVNLTDRMSGTTANWGWEVDTVYVNNASVSFSWSDGVLTIPGYTTGTVLAEFTLYLIYGQPSEMLPFDPTDPLSDEIYWENRLTNFFTYSSSIKAFESGLTEITGTSIAITIDDDWSDLIRALLVWSNRTIRIYQNDVLIFKGITTKMAISDKSLSIQIQKRQTILEADLHWGDPSYLNVIDRSSNTAYYNGANIPEAYEGFVIPMLFGPHTPYEQTADSEVDLGTPAPTFLIPPGTKGAARSVNSGAFMARVIPTSSSSGIIGRMPSWQSISGTAINQTLTGPAHTYGRAEQGSNSFILTTMIPGEVCTLERTTGPSPIINSARLYNYNSAKTRGFFIMSVDDTTYTNYDVIKDCNTNFHYFPSNLPTTAWTTGAVLSGTFTPGGNRLLTVSSITGLDLLNDELYVVITNVSGARSAPEVLKFALEQHGYTVDAASFAALAAEFTQTTIQMAGRDNNTMTLGAFVGEINRSLMTILVFPASNDIPFLQKIDANQAASTTLSEDQILGLKFDHEYRDQAKNVTWKPKYALADSEKDSLRVKQTSSVASLFQSERSIEIEHVLTGTPTTRWQEITEIYGSPASQVSFTLLDDEVEIELGDCVQLDHPSCTQKVLILSIGTQSQGRLIGGRFLYVNN